MPDRNGKIFYTSITSLSHISKGTGIVGGQTSQMEKIGQAVANAAVQKVLQKVDPSGTLSTVQSNLQR